jgi:hypothetical protein
MHMHVHMQSAINIFFCCYEIMAWDSPNDKSRPGRVILNAKIQPEYMYININI